MPAPTQRQFSSADRDPAANDLDQFQDFLRHLPEREPRLLGFFAHSAEGVLARAPGRLDVLGGIADYSGSLVLEQPIREAALVAVARSDDSLVRIASLSGAALREVAFSAAALERVRSSWSEARAYFVSLGAERWVAYLAGAVTALALDFGFHFEGGLRILLQSAVPEGKGVSSSAAIEVATLRAFCALCRVDAAPELLALSCQRIENRVVGAACGVMDQMTSACGEHARLLALRCQPAQIVGQLTLPSGVRFFGIDSGLRHAVTGADYTQIRVAAFMGLRILAEQLGARVAARAPGRVKLEADPLGGYLANLTPAELTPRLRTALPEHISGADFLARWAGISDDVTTIDAGASYPVRAATEHPIYEHARVREFAGELEASRTDTDLTRLGSLMYQSHASYSSCGLGSSGTDRLVELVRAAGSARGLFGAKITGGGSGGTVAILGRADALPAVAELAQRYAAETGRFAQVFVGSSTGAVGTPPRRVEFG